MYTNPFTEFGQPFWSIIPPSPWYIGDPVPDPYQVGDFPPYNPRDKKAEEGYQKGWADWIDSLNKAVPVALEKEYWFDNTDGGQTFRLEVVGYGKEHISAEIKETTLIVTGTNGKKSFTQKFPILSPEKLDLAAISAKVEHGLLEIIFPPKKQEVKSIKVL